MKLNVPYYSQYLDVSNPNWQSRACGIVCLKMLLESKGVHAPSLDDMISQGDAIGVYGESGWKHDGLVALAHQYGAKLSRAEWRQSRRASMDTARMSSKSEFGNSSAESKSPDELNEEGINVLISKLRTYCPVLVSAIKNFEEDDKFHMVILTGFEEKDGVVTGFYYHDSAATTKEEGEHLFVALGTFRAKWRRMAIF